MKKSDRYVVPENEGYEPGSNDTVLKNKLNIKTEDEIEKIESIALKEAEDNFLKKYAFNHSFTSKDLLEMHKDWLIDIYAFAGKYRTVNMEKNGFRFASAPQIPKLMQQFEAEQLKIFTPCAGTVDEVSFALAVVHVEFILIHPFREGNGRLGRALASLMVAQAGFPLPDFYAMALETIGISMGKDFYIKAVHAGMDRNYKPMQEIFLAILQKSINA